MDLPEAPPPQGLVMQMVMGAWVSRTISAITRLDIPDLLEEHGFIVQKATGDGRKAKAPTLVFEYNVVIVYMPQVTYKIEFGEAA